MKPGQPFADLPALVATDKQSLSVQTKDQIGVFGDAPADHFRGITKMIACGKRWVCDRFATQRVANFIGAARKATTEKSSVVRSGWRTLS